MAEVIILPVVRIERHEMAIASAIDRRNIVNLWRVRLKRDLEQVAVMMEEAAKPGDPHG